MGLITIHTDGACSGNPGPGGWGAILEWDGHKKELKGGEPETTNNRMELMAAIQALEALKKDGRNVRLITDSTYVRDGVTKWVHTWKRNGWKTSAKKPVKNDDLWKRLDEVAQKHEIDWQWVKGHTGDPGNERADELARMGILDMEPSSDDIAVATKRHYVTMDVFTDRAFGGNPLGVVFDADGLDTEAMQAIAREFNYSETTFFLPPTDPANDAVLRIFTPAREIPFAGHPNIGSALAAASKGELFGKAVGDILRFEEKAGLVAIALTQENGVVSSAEFTAPEELEISDTVEPEIIAACAGLDVVDLVVTSHAPVAVSVGFPFTIAEVADLETLGKATIGPDTAFCALPTHAYDLLIYTRLDENRIQARMFGPLDQVPEDPATGSACAALMGLIAHLDERDDGMIELDIAQGIEMGRPSQIRARAIKQDGLVTSVCVSGQAVQVMSGHLHI